MATMPRPQVDLPSQPMLDPSANRIDELIRLQKSAQRITSTLDLDEIIDRVVNEVSDFSRLRRDQPLRARSEATNSS